MTFNIHYGEGKDGIQNLSASQRLLENVMQILLGFKKLATLIPEAGL